MSRKVEELQEQLRDANLIYDQLQNLKQIKPERLGELSQGLLRLMRQCDYVHPDSEVDMKALDFVALATTDIPTMKSSQKYISEFLRIARRIAQRHTAFLSFMLRQKEVIGNGRATANN